MDNEDQWREFGYDIANFTIPKTVPINSNYLNSAAPEVPEEPEVDEESKAEEDEKTAEDLANEKRERVT